MMWKWMLTGVLYVTLVILGFEAYDKWFADQKKTAAQESGHGGQEEGHSGNAKGAEAENGEGHEESEEHGHGEESKTAEGHAHGGGGSAQGMGSQVNAFIQNENNTLKIYLKDKAGNPVDELEVNHEKILHLIITDEQLQKYYHVHPERTGKGEFEVKTDLPNGLYKGFVDIKPKNLSYGVEPIPFVIGSPDQKGHGHPLVPDTNFSKTLDGETANLSISTFKANEPAQLSFELDKTNLKPYLGAMGHVVILDEAGKKFLHVHPSNDKDTIFETTFEKPGVYKIWAEFQQNGKVRAFPYVVEIKE